ncbi:hypothetical protein G6O67_005718 [Ophiocordyceps sinensis]|uniref:t-SNARE coiled-coil homology domain-containing protein n=2 Tax=Ophiocordyceps sinensis TaxID=72228 RepID=A0A8H4LXU8_9HYPO|nr:SNARE complex subunit (Syn8) [Ophiocordyceps sinensis CO18]KAF4507042.1 hypothetical protein G6O67_005718 [Ophiocordyceps sinensis]
MSKPSHLFLLADHIKLSLLERQRAKSLDLDSDTQDGHLSRSLDQFRTGLAALQQEMARKEQADDHSAATSIENELAILQKQYDGLTAQYHGFSNPTSEATLNYANSDALTDDFAHAASTSPVTHKPKTVRFTDTPSSPSDQLFKPYSDNPNHDSAAYCDQSAELTNQQLHEYHSQILNNQDEQLDRLGESIGRQRELSMQIGDELDSHVAMLDEVETVTDRHQGRLDRAKNTLRRVARDAGENKQMTAIVVLIIILVLLIAILK